jgi:hypothetical protein
MPVNSIFQAAASWAPGQVIQFTIGPKAFVVSITNAPTGATASPSIYSIEGIPTGSKATNYIPVPFVDQVSGAFTSYGVGLLQFGGARLPSAACCTIRPARAWSALRLRWVSGPRGDASVAEITAGEETFGIQRMEANLWR